MLGWAFALRRVAVELRGLRRAAERIADALELQGPGSGPRAFRGLSREKSPAPDAAGSSVSYVDEAEQARVFAAEGELRALLGRDPLPEEIERALAGDVE